MKSHYSLRNFLARNGSQWLPRTIRPLRMKKFLAFALPLFCTASVFAADVAYTKPVGGIAVSVTGGTTVAPITTRFAIPLTDTPAASGITVGQISALTSSTITVSNANWVSGALSATNFPYAVRLTSGAGEGATLTVAANTADTLTVSGRDLTQLGVAAGDKFRLIPIDTLNTLFGSTTFLGGANSDSADVVTLSSTVSLSYYYNNSLNRWVRTTGPTSDRGNTPIPPDSVISVTRKSGQLTLYFTGVVPDSKFNFLVANSGTTYTHTGFPKDVTIGALAVQNNVAGWVGSSTATNSDTLAVNSGGTWLTYFYNGSFWQRTTGPATNRDAIVISAGTPIQFFKRGSAAGFSAFTRAVPYTI